MGPTRGRARIIVVYNASPFLIKGEPQDMLAEQGVIACLQAVAAALAGRYEVQRVPIHADVEVALAPYLPTEWVVFNLGEGIQGRLFEEARNRMGAGSNGYCMTRLAVEMRRPVPYTRCMPNSCLRVWASRRRVAPASHLRRGGGWSRFPLIVKPVAEDGSLGIGPEAVVHDLAALRERVGHTIECYRQAALVEEFITGREFNVSLWGDSPEVLPLAEIDFRDFADPCNQIVSFAAKWDATSFAYHHTPVLCLVSVDRRLAGRIQEAALAAWHVIGCQGYGTFYMRVRCKEPALMRHRGKLQPRSLAGGRFLSSRA